MIRVSGPHPEAWTVGGGGPSCVACFCKCPFSDLFIGTFKNFSILSETRTLRGI